MSFVSEKNIIKWLKAMGAKDPNGMVLSEHNINKLNTHDLRPLWDALLSRVRRPEEAQRARELARHKVHIEAVKERLAIRDRLQQLDAMAAELQARKAQLTEQITEQTAEVVGAEARWQQDRNQLQVRPVQLFGLLLTCGLNPRAAITACVIVAHCHGCSDRRLLRIAANLATSAHMFTAADRRRLHTLQPMPSAAADAACTFYAPCSIISAYSFVTLLQRSAAQGALGANPQYALAPQKTRPAPPSASVHQFVFQIRWRFGLSHLRLPPRNA